jgi:hypothetical protein
MVIWQGKIDKLAAKALSSWKNEKPYIGKKNQQETYMHGYMNGMSIARYLPTKKLKEIVG